MEVFLNELSVHAQFEDISGFSNSLVRVNRLLGRLVGVKIRKSVFFDSGLYYRQVFSQANFTSCLAKIADSSIRTHFKVLLRDKLNATDWRIAQTHSTCSYTDRGQDVCGSSVAEFAERMLIENEGFLLNFSPSKYSNESTYKIVKQVMETVLVASVSNDEDWITFFRSAKVGVVVYDFNSLNTPRDDETILSDKSRFFKTNLRNQGRAVYFDRPNSCYFCVDNLHFGESAHLEVFGSDGSHIGEANLDGKINLGKIDSAKYLDL